MWGWSAPAGIGGDCVTTSEVKSGGVCQVIIRELLSHNDNDLAHLLPQMTTYIKRLH
jgi:hypothetical protein